MIYCGMVVWVFVAWGLHVVIDAYCEPGKVRYSERQDYRAMAVVWPLSLVIAAFILFSIGVVMPFKFIEALWGWVKKCPSKRALFEANTCGHERTVYDHRE